MFAQRLMVDRIFEIASITFGRSIAATRQSEQA